MSTERYVEFLYPGSFVSESSSVHREGDAKIPFPERAMGYRTFEREEIEAGGETLRGKAKNHSPWTYIGAVYTLADVEREMPTQDILISNMRINNYARVVRTRSGMTLPLNADDIALAQAPADV